MYRSKIVMRNYAENGDLNQGENEVVVAGWKSPMPPFLPGDGDPMRAWKRPRSNTGIAEK